MLTQELQALGIVPSEIPAKVWDRVIHESGKRTRRELFSDVGLGRSLAAVIARRLAEHDEVPQSDVSTSAPLLIRGTRGMAIQLASCCQPIPGDPIIGLLRKDQGLRVHTHACDAVRKSRTSEPQNWIHVEWEPDPGQFFDVRIKVTAKNVSGVLGRVSTSIAQSGVNIDYVNMNRKEPGLFTDIHFLVQVSGRTHLALLMRGLRRIPDVVRIVREQESS